MQDGGTADDTVDSAMDPSEGWYSEPSEGWYSDPSEGWYSDPSEGWYSDSSSVTASATLVSETYEIRTLNHV